MGMSTAPAPGGDTPWPFGLTPLNVSDGVEGEQETETRRTETFRQRPRASARAPRSTATEAASKTTSFNRNCPGNGDSASGLPKPG